MFIEGHRLVAEDSDITRLKVGNALEYSAALKVERTKITIHSLKWLLDEVKDVEVEKRLRLAIKDLEVIAEQAQKEREDYGRLSS